MVYGIWLHLCVFMYYLPCCIYFSLLIMVCAITIYVWSVFYKFCHFTKPTTYTDIQRQTPQNTKNQTKNRAGEYKSSHVGTAICNTPR